MLRSKASLVAIVACLAGVVSGSIAGAQANAGATGSTGSTGATAVPATITVNGSGTGAVASNAPATTFQSTYLSALEAALSDAHTKATALAAQSGDTLGAVQNITEQSNDGNGCSGPIMYAAGGVAKSAPAGAPSPHKPRHHSKPTHAIARLADVTPPTTCGVQANVTVTYGMS